MKEEKMATALKFILFFLFIFILFNNAKACNPVNEQDISAGNNFSTGQHYSFVLQ